MATPNRPTPPSTAALGSRRSSIRKRQHPPVFNGLQYSYEDRNNDFLCPICFDIIEEAYITKCGHSFCFKCILKSLEQSNRCPKCNFTLESKEQIFPNFLLNELILKHRQQMDEKKLRMEKMNGHHVSELQEFLSQESDNLELADVNFMLEVLVQKKQQLEADCKAAHFQLLKEFLQQVRRHKQDQLERLTKEITFIDDDSKKVESFFSGHSLVNSASSIVPEQYLLPGGSGVVAGSSGVGTVPVAVTPPDSFNGNKTGDRLHQFPQSTLAARRKRMHVHFDDLEQSYLNLKGDEFGESRGSGLEEFQENLVKFTKYSGMRTLATLSYACDIFNGSSIVSSIEFDKDSEFFAIAGVTKKIKVFEYSMVVQDAVDIHYPVNEMVCNSKISCVSWSSYHKGTMASSDYEGTVTVWDAFTGQKARVFQEHEKRCWSVDFNRVDTKLIASGSDDAKVKLWATDREHSIASLEAKANVCCVKFSPTSRYHLAFGSADHCVHYYDLRNPKLPLGVFKGHRKAVSYAKFLNPDEIVSASTDSQLKLWNINKPYSLRSFKGHTNEKNFVGLATDGDYIVCGSENNSLFVYYKGLSKQLLTMKFDTVRSVLDKDKKEEDANEFVSAVCWRQGSNVVVAANSQGTIKVLELI